MFSNRLIIFGFAVLFLAACSGAQKADSPDIAVSSQSDVVLNPAPPAGMDPMGQGRLANAPGVQPVPQFPAPNDRDLVVMTNKLAGGSVELYPVDGSLPVSSPPKGKVFDTQGLPATLEPSVTVYPLSDSGPYPGELPASSMTSWPNDVLPRAPMRDMSGIERVSPRSAGGAGSTSIYFDHGSAALDTQDMDVLKAAAEEAKFAPVERVSIEGHASSRAGTGDPVKDSILNLKESMNRAFEVSKHMILDGVPAEKLKTTAYGDTVPPPTGEEETARRVEIHTGAGY